jgi:hypothetical protein
MALNRYLFRQSLEQAQLFKFEDIFACQMISANIFDFPFTVKILPQDIFDIAYRNPNFAKNSDS